MTDLSSAECLLYICVAQRDIATSQLNEVIAARHPNY